MAGDGEMTRPLTQALTERRRVRPATCHEHPPMRNCNDLAEDRLTAGHTSADGVTATMGSSRFSIIQRGLLACWLTVTAVAFFNPWDRYPFLLLNRARSFQAAYAASIIMLSQNRQAMKDRLAAAHDFQIDVKAEDEVQLILAHLDDHEHPLLDLVARMQGGASATAATPD
jgi:uncharacterized membrane protein